jgi:LSD1 subclass zinc finger protein
MKGFCTDCRNLLSFFIKDGDLHLRCAACQKEYESTPEDSLIYEENLNTNIAVFDRILKKAGKDPVNLKAMTDCRKCPSKVVRQVRIEKEMILFNVCTECNYAWPYAS